METVDFGSYDDPNSIFSTGKRAVKLFYPELENNALVCSIYQRLQTQVGPKYLGYSNDQARAIEIGRGECHRSDDPILASSALASAPADQVRRVLRLRRGAVLMRRSPMPPAAETSGKRPRFRGGMKKGAPPFSEAPWVSETLAALRNGTALPRRRCGAGSAHRLFPSTD